MARLLLLPLILVTAARAEDPDVLFAKARALPKERREEARALCRQALADHPDYDDVRIHLARLHAWDHQYDDARRELAYVLDRRPANQEAREVLVDVEVWSDHPHEALRQCGLGLAQGPSAELLYKKARILKSLGDVEGAYKAAQAAITEDPDHQAARKLREDLSELRQRDKVVLGASYETYSAQYGHWLTDTLTLGHRFDQGTVLAMVNHAHRFDTWGDQFELDAYPHLGEGTYAYLSAARSGSFIFPSQNYMAQVYHNFSHGLEASLGGRYMDFSGSKVSQYLGTFGKYHGDAYYYLLLTLTPGATGSSLSEALKGRWYLSDADSWVGLAAGTGLSPNLIPWSAQVVKFRSTYATADIQKRLPHSWILAALVSREQMEYQPDTYLAHWTWSASVEKRF